MSRQISEMQTTTALAEAALRSLALRTADHHGLPASRPTSAGGRHRADYLDTRNGNALTDCVRSPSRSRWPGYSLRSALAERNVIRVQSWSC